ncbi:MAG: dolichol-phosphate mannosyltransferase [Candidatus Peregrinibacteria bacterium Greene0416_19]|nr:MAG: dolichol-phosphate mannosyltransferase [Candidatus Peregrinibacteria bacterium Greene0416_19]
MQSNRSPVPHEITFVSVILPTYNEVENIVPLTEAIHGAIRYPHEIIVVDDNSPDGTSQAVRYAIDSGSVQGLRLETRLTDRGLTKSIQQGIDLAQGDVIVWMDCDFSMPPEKILELLARVEEGYDMAIGSRFVAGGSTKDFDAGGGKEESKLVIVLSQFLNWLTRFLLYKNFHDYTSGFIAVRKEVLESIPLCGDYGEYFMDLMVHAIKRGYTFIEIPYTCVPRRAGETKTGGSIMVIVRRGMKYLWALARLWCFKIFG